MPLTDCYNIISKPVILNDDIKLSNYFLNKLESDIDIFMKEYIHQIVYNNVISKLDILKCFEKILINYLTEIRKQMRIQIKKDNFDLSSITNFITTLFIKVDDIAFSLDNKELLELSKYNIFSILLTDTTIINYLEKFFINFENSLEVNRLLEKLIFYNINFMKTELNMNYFSQETLLLIETFFSNILNFYKKEIINFDILPISYNYQLINNYINSIKYLEKIREYFNYNIILQCSLILECYNNKLIIGIYNIIFDYLIQIIKNNTIKEIYYTLENSIKNLTVMILYFKNTDNYINNFKLEIEKELLFLINKYINDEDIIYIYKIISKILNIIPSECLRLKINSMFNTNKYYHLINEEIDINIKSENLNAAVENLLIIKHITNKDEFINIYYDYLIKRLLSKNNRTSDYLLNEENLINKLIVYTNYKYYELKTIIKDFSKFKNYTINNINVNILSTSYSCWNLNFDNSFCTNDTKFFENINLINKSYMDLLNSDTIKLCWLLHYGEVNIKYLNKSIKLLPIQYLILEKFDVNDIIDINDILNYEFFKNYDNKFKNDIIKTFLISRLLLLDNNRLKLNNNNNFKTNLINIFFSINDYNDISEQREIEFVHSRIDITKTNINKIIKNNSLNKIDLFNKTKENINIFELDEDIFNNALDYMIKMDYIELIDDKYHKLLY